MRPVLLSTTVALIGSVLASTSVAAHFGSGAYIVVPADHINPGSPFVVIAADLSPESTVEFAMIRDERVAPLGTFVSSADGHFQTELQLPSDFPAGYVELLATSPDGTQASVWVLVGPRTDSTPAAPGQAAPAAWWADPSVIVLGLFVVGAVAVVGYLLLRPKSAAPAPVRVSRRRVPPKKGRSR